MSTPLDGPELTRRLPRAVVRLAQARSRALPFLLRAAFRFEGGDFRSATARDLLRACCGVEIGAYSYGDCFVPGAFPPGTVVGRYVSIAEGVRGLGRNHPMDRLSTHPYFFNSRLGVVATDNEPYGRLEVGSDAWLGLRAVIAPGCRRVGIGAVVAACSVVTHDVDDFAIVAGVPARVLRYRFPREVRAAIRRSGWWELPIEELARHVETMKVPLAALPATHPLLADSAAGRAERVLS